MADGLKIDPVFIGLTRPPLFFGTSYSYFLLNLLVSMIFYINLTSFKVIFISGLIHLVGVLLCNKEPLFIELILNKSQKCNLCKNKLYHGANSYDMY